MPKAYVSCKYEDINVLWGGAPELWGQALQPPEDHDVTFRIFKANQEEGHLQVGKVASRSRQDRGDVSYLSSVRANSSRKTTKHSYF